MIVLLDSYF